MPAMAASHAYLECCAVSTSSRNVRDLFVPDYSRDRDRRKKMNPWLIIRLSRDPCVLGSWYYLAHCKYRVPVCGIFVTAKNLQALKSEVTVQFTEGRCLFLLTFTKSLMSKLLFSTFDVTKQVRLN